MRNNKKRKQKNVKSETPALPQNILPVGERVFEDKNIYIHQKIYKEIHKFAANKTENEHGGILVGRVVNELGKENTIIEGFIEAKNNVATPTTLTFTHETWEHFHSEIDKKYKEKKIVGWIHTHPNFGIFLSENDRFIQQNFFADVNQVAYVVDPIQDDEGFFFWIDGKLERCPGFYLFDINGAKLKPPVVLKDDDEAVDENRYSTRYVKVLSIAVAILFFVNVIFMVNKTAQINQLKNENHKIKNELYSINSLLQQQMIIMQGMQLKNGVQNNVPESDPNANPENDDDNKQNDDADKENAPGFEQTIDPLSEDDNTGGDA